MNHSGSPGIRAVDVWDVLVSAITQAGSIGENLDDYTAARAAAIDELLAGNLPTDIAANLTAIGLIPTTAQRGTDNALLAANYLGYQLSRYTYGPTALNHGMSYTPPDKTLVTQAILDDATVDAQTEFYWSDNETGETIADAFIIADTPNKTVINRAVMCDGTNTRIYNVTGAAKNLKLLGWQFA